MTLSLQLYWSFRSPYSYLVLPRVVALAGAMKCRWNCALCLRRRCEIRTTFAT